jgi:predicted AAA+ superfamily ATPase
MAAVLPSGVPLIPRSLAAGIHKMASWFPVVSVTGPRQSGKSTIVRAAFPDYTYVNLEDVQVRRQAREDPVGFIRNRPAHLILDEAQYVPDLFSMIQVVSDERGTTGQYILSGSQNFLLLKRIKQSLAGRVGIIRLLPLSYEEACDSQLKPSVDEFMFRGGFPRLYDRDTSGETIPSQIFFSSYLNTYIDRDVTGNLDVRDSVAFRRLLRLCALESGNLVNYANLARDASVDYRTVRQWLSILEASYVLFPLQPYYSNHIKSLTKTPKLYFYDTGLLCWLLGIRTLGDLLTSDRLGAVFENLIVEETLKNHLNRLEEPELYFYRDSAGTEVDLLDLTDSARPRMAEIKSGQTYHDRFASKLGPVGEKIGVPREGRFVVSRVESGFETKEASVRTAQDWLLSGSAHVTPDES